VGRWRRRCRRGAASYLLLRLRQLVFPTAVFSLLITERRNRASRKTDMGLVGASLWQCVVSKGARERTKVNKKAPNLITAHRPRSLFMPIADCAFPLSRLSRCFRYLLAPKWLRHGVDYTRRVNGGSPWRQCGAACATCVAGEVASHQQGQRVCGVGRSHAVALGEKRRRK
jgi:hypothetical protein